MSGLFNEASLVLVPSGYKAGKVYSEVPTDGDGDLTFTRASSATRVNSDGLIEKARTNLLLQSNTFDTTWTNTNSTETSGQAGYDGTNDAWLLTRTGGNGRVQQSISNTGVQTFSIYAKANTLSWIVLEIAGIGFAYYDIENGVLGTNNSGISTSIDSVGNSWYRCSFIGNGTSTTIRVYLANGNNDLSGTSGSVLIQNAQLETGSTATEYIPTTTSARTTFAGITQDGTSASNVPRLDYSQGSCPALLLEPQRTNLVTYSNEFDNAAWTILTESTSTMSITPNYATAQNGLSASRLVATRPSTSFLSLLANFVSDTNTATKSVWIKNNNSGSVNINISDQAITVTDTWQRYEITNNYPHATIGLRYASADLNCDISIAGFQFEVGSYATSYIPTLAATVTRLSDSFTRNNVYTNGLITSSGGTWVVELRSNKQLIADSATIGFWLGTSSVTPANNGTLYFRQGGGSQRSNIWKYESGTATQLYIPTTDTTKVAFKWNGTTADVFVNGTKVVSATSFTATNMEFLATTGVGRPFFISQMDLFPTPLEDVDCEVLTGEIYTSYSEMATALGYTII